MSRLDDLIGQDFQVLPFRDLSPAHQMALAWYMSVEGCAWDTPFDWEVDVTKQDVENALPLYAETYGDEMFGVASISAADMKRAIMCDEEISEDFENGSWDDYVARYFSRGDDPAYSDGDGRWPGVLSSTDDETLQDGWHRVNSYLRSGHADIPVVFFPRSRHVDSYRRRMRNDQASRPRDV